MGSVVRWLGGTGAGDVGQRRLDHTDLDRRGDLDLDKALLDLGHLAQDATGGDDRIALLDRFDRRLQRLHAALLGANHQKIEDDEDKKQRREAEERAHAATGGRTGGLGVG